MVSCFQFVNPLDGESNGFPPFRYGAALKITQGKRVIGSGKCKIILSPLSQTLTMKSIIFSSSFCVTLCDLA